MVLCRVLLKSHSYHTPHLKACQPWIVHWHRILFLCLRFAPCRGCLGKYYFIKGSLHVLFRPTLLVCYLTQDLFPMYNIQQELRPLSHFAISLKALSGRYLHEWRNRLNFAVTSNYSLNTRLKRRLNYNLNFAFFNVVERLTDSQCSIQRQLRLSLILLIFSNAFLITRWYVGNSDHVCPFFAIKLSGSLECCYMGPGTRSVFKRWIADER